MLDQGQSSSAKRGGLADVSSGLLFLEKKKNDSKNVHIITYIMYQLISSSQQPHQVDISNESFSRMMKLKRREVPCPRSDKLVIGRAGI